MAEITFLATDEDFDAIWAMIFMGFSPFGALLVGLLATTIGTTATLRAQGAGCGVAAAVFAGWSWSSRAWVDAPPSRR